jgi:uncharacterized protein DUF1573
MRIRLTIFLLAIIPVLLVAQGQPELAFVSKVHDFGIMKQNTRETHEFIFYNPGSETILLGAPKAGCGCTAVLLDNYELAPGDTGRISVTFSAVAGVTGKVEKHVYMFTADNLTDYLAVLTVKVKIVGDVDIEPSYVRYNSVVGEVQEIPIKVTGTSKVPVNLDNISAALMEFADTTAGPEYHANSVIASPVTDFSIDVEKKVLQPGESTIVLLSIPSREKGQINGSLRISLAESVVTVGVAGVISRE